MKKLQRWLPDLIFIALLFAGRSSLADHYYVPSGSMEYTLMPGDRVVVNKMAYGVEFPFSNFELFGGASPQAGEVVVFNSPVDGRRLIKRVVATSGDLVTLRNGHMYLNGRALECGTDAERECFGERLAEINLSYGSGEDIDGLIIPAGKVLAIGDSRGNSFDSRSYGLINEADLDGRAIGVYYRREQGFVWRPL